MKIAAAESMEHVFNDDMTKSYERSQSPPVYKLWVSDGKWHVDVVFSGEDTWPEIAERLRKVAAMIDLRRKA